ncbi:hypothetical protein C8R46DRAFT_1123702 [Mycena filopes]|nr:hypothetical protein C8R46DRAFT_1123702 [Mycena filopes]
MTLYDQRARRSETLRSRFEPSVISRRSTASVHSDTSESGASWRSRDSRGSQRSGMSRRFRLPSIGSVVAAFARPVSPEPPKYLPPIPEGPQEPSALDRERHLRAQLHERRRHSSIAPSISSILSQNSSAAGTEFSLEDLIGPSPGGNLPADVLEPTPLSMIELNQYSPSPHRLIGTVIRRPVPLPVCSEVRPLFGRAFRQFGARRRCGQRALFAALRLPSGGHAETSPSVLYDPSLVTFWVFRDPGAWGRELTVVRGDMD